jgi:hypothetical protein
MTRGRRWGWLLAATIVSSPAAARAAGHHQICFQSSDGTYTNVVGILRCRADDPAVSCTITIPAALTTTAYATVGNETSLLATFASSGVFTSTISFSDGVTRTCTLETIPPNQMPSSYMLPSLLGYTTDSSGLVMTGVWAQSWVVFPAKTEADLPVGFRAVGGGASGNYVTAAMSEYPGVWYAADVEPWGNVIPAQHFTGYGIGLKIEGIDWATLASMVQQSSSAAAVYQPPPAASPAASVPTVAGQATIGGGVYATLGQAVTASYPKVVQRCYAGGECEQVVTSWEAASNVHNMSGTGQVQSIAVSLPKQLSIGGTSYWVETWVTNAATPATTSPQVSVAGLLGDYALTGAGALIDGQTAAGPGGNLLSVLKPHPETAGVEAATTTEPGFSSTAGLTVYAVGMRLVPGSVPPARHIWWPPPIVTFPAKPPLILP